MREGRVLAVIPARYGSTRFMGKALALLSGKEIILRVVEQAKMCRTVDDVIVATDDDRILATVRNAGHRAEMTSPDHRSGTERIAEVAERSAAAIVVNIQGDEPMIDPASVDRAVQALVDDPALSASTLAVPIDDPDEFADPGAVKVVTTNDGMALYFSRAPIPHNRDGGEPFAPHKHLGLYAYRRDFLMKYAAMAPTGLEQTEKLEQLRILQHGYGIKVLIADKDSIGIDTPDDLAKAEKMLAEGAGGNG